MEKPPVEFWAVAGCLEPLQGGSRNRAFRTRGLNHDLVFKTTRREAAAIEWLVPVLELAESSGFIVPKPIKSSYGRYVEQGWTCEPFLHGGRFLPEDLSCIASRLRLFQMNAREMPQRPGFLAATDFVEREFGGDVDLRAMPADMVALCRSAWVRIATWPKSTVHGDLNARNLIWIANGGIGLVDWDEARVDAMLFDDFHTGEGDARAVEAMAVLAWEVACSWVLEPEYARRTAEKLRQAANSLE